MSVAIRTATRLQDQDDVNVSLGAGVDEYALCWDNDTARFVLRATTGYDHGLLAAASLSDDDHTQYALLAGRAGGQTLYGGTDANDDITIHGTSNATRTTSYVLLQPTAGNVGIGTSVPGKKLEVNGNGLFTLDTADAGRGLAVEMYSTDSNAANMRFIRARGTKGSPSALVSGDSIGFFRVSAYDGSNYLQPAYFGFKVDSAVSAGSVGTAIVFGTGVASFGTERMRITSVGQVGIGIDAPLHNLHVRLTNATTNAVNNPFAIGHDSTGTPAAGFGTGIRFYAQSSTTSDQNAANIAASWIVATHATRTARLALSAYDYNGEREGMRIDTDGSAALLGFYAHAATAQQVLATGAGASVDDVITALQNLGLVKQS